MCSNRSRILIADDHNLIAELCKKLLESEFTVLGTVSDGQSVIQAAAKLKPDLIVLDVAMPVLNGLDAGRQVKHTFPAIKLVYLTMNPDPEIAAEAFRHGASAYLVKTCASEELLIAVRNAFRGKTYLSPSLPRDTIAFLRNQENNVRDQQDRLTARQREVLQLLAEGKVMKEVGSILNMTTRTVAFHKYRIMETLGAKNNADLVRYAVRNHLVPLDNVGS